MSQLQESSQAPAARVGTVFIVDDEMMVTSSLQTMLLLESNHHIHCYNSPLEALAHVPQLRPDVVISDFSMPGMDGIHFLREVKALLPEATLILLTGYADKENAIEAINTVGIYRYIEKPWDNEALKMTINNGLERSHLIGDLRASVEALTAARGELETTNRRLESLVEERTQDLRATYQTLSSIVNNTADGILTLNADLAITSINPAAARWFHRIDTLQDVDLKTYSLETLVRTNVLKLMIADGKQSHSIQTLLDPYKPHQVSELMIGDLPLEASISPLPNDAYPDKPGFVLVLRDITERKEIERLRDDFVSTLTHDLRTPLLAAIQTLGFFADGSLGELPARQKELVQMLIQSNREMLGLVNVLLEVYKYESGRQKLILDNVRLDSLIAAICQELDALSRERQQDLQLMSQSEAFPDGFTVHGDKQELKRVFVNLIGNAINYTPKGGKLQVELSVDTTTAPNTQAPKTPSARSARRMSQKIVPAPSGTSQPNEQLKTGSSAFEGNTTTAGKPSVTICVQDNGRGIPAQDIPLLFQRFSQGTSKQRSSGSGLGLYLSRQIVEAHQGHIWVESEEGKGSRFYVRLPLA